MVRTKKRVLVSISYCCDHIKGDQPIQGQTKAEWLESAVDWWIAQYPFPVIVVCTGFRGILKVNNSAEDCERDVLWRIIKKVKNFVGYDTNPGHQIGAAMCVRLGLEYAAKIGFQFLVHTAEDILPEPGVVWEMIEALDKGKFYAGLPWGPDCGQLTSAFFAVRVHDLLPQFDPGVLPNTRGLEDYLHTLLKDKPRWLMLEYYDRYLLGGNHCFRHTHDYSVWRQWLKEIDQ